MPDLGEYVVKCIKPGGDTLSTYGDFAATQDQSIDLLADSTPDSLRAGSYWTAQTMCEDPGFELAQKIAAGTWQVVSKRQPLEPA
ncbi:MAG TPA: hypothetical protein VLD67_17025 [Vicinamibacterales bacterium]|nr:hypothetical protein [Vicinamibacterales bacterium]